MKKTLSIIIISFTLIFCCYSNIRISIEPILSTTFGKYGEYVFSSSDKYLLSYLEWQQLPLIKMGINSSISINNLSFSTRFSYGLPLKCGKMYDSDWNENGIKTTYSISNNYAIYNYDFSIGLSYKFNFKYISLIPEINYKYYNDYFQSNDGEGWYGRDIYSKTGKTVSWDSPDARHYRKLSRIELKRESNYLFLGLSLTGTIFSKIDFAIATFIAPFAYVYNSDLHLDDNGTGKDFYLNSTQNAYFSRFMEKVSFTYKINKRISIPINIECILGEIEKGLLDDYEQYGGTDVIQFEIRTGVQFII